MSTNPTEDLILEFETTKKEVEKLEGERTAGAQIRARCTHIENNEANSQYFFSKEMANAQSKAMTSMILHDSSTTQDIKKIAKEQVLFYKDLYEDKATYSTTETKEANKHFFNKDIKLEKLNDDDKEALEVPIVQDDFAKALNSLSNNKSPGIDGLPCEFYKFFWVKIKAIVSDSLLYGLESGKLSIDQRRAVLMLLPKKDKDHR
jgi:hypothetical protein